MVEMRKVLDVEYGTVTHYPDRAVLERNQSVGQALQIL